MPGQFSRVFKRPFGPYPASVLLSVDELPSQLDLKDVWMVWGGGDVEGKPVGLDETERLIYDKRDPVHIYGVLRIAKKKWLSAHGKKFLKSDLQERYRKMFPNSQDRPTLEWVFESTPLDDRNLYVYVQFLKSKTASFLTATKHEKELVMFTYIGQRSNDLPGKRRTTDLVIRSLDVQTYALSRNFLEHWRLLMSIKLTLRELGRDAPSLRQRSAKWILEIMHERHLDKARLRRLIFSSDDEDRAEDDDDDDEPQVMNLRCRRRPCHITTCECADILATHGEWLLFQLTESSNCPETRYINLRNLYAFCKKSKKKKQEEIHEGSRSWGREYIVSEWAEETENLRSMIDISERYGWTEHHLRRLSNQFKTIALKRQKQVEMQDQFIRRDADYPSDEESEEYDREFAESSSEYEVEPRAHRLEKRDLITRVPWWCTQTPKIQGWKWYCPDPECPHRIDLMKLCLPNGRSPSLQSPEMLDLLCPRVTEHMNEHIRSRGVSFELIDERAWPPKVRLISWPPGDGNASSSGAGEHAVKEEEEEEDF